MFLTTTVVVGSCAFFFSCFSWAIQVFFLPLLFLFNIFAGEYAGLAGARLDGAEMLACGLATHYVSSTVCLKYSIVLVLFCEKSFI